jgi:ornithine carbamoyltransferase
MNKFKNFGSLFSSGVSTNGKKSVIFDEAENRMWAQNAIMVTLTK